MTYEALRTIFQARGWAVSIATTVAEALAELDLGAPEAIVLDLMLPDGEGVMILQQVRQRGLDCRVVVTTGTSDPERLEAARQFKPLAVLHKPVDVEQLQKSLLGQA
jgi:two-component system response regulator RegA